MTESLSRKWGNLNVYICHIENVENVIKETLISVTYDIEKG